MLRVAEASKRCRSMKWEEAMLMDLGDSPLIGRVGPFRYTI